MTFEEFWNICTNEKIVDNFEAVKEIFSQRIHHKILMDYDIVEVLLEFQGHNETAKNFEEILEVIELLKTKNTHIYNGEIFPYYNNFLVNYHCYTNNKEELALCVTAYQENHLQDYDYLYSSLLKIFFYGYTDLGEQLIDDIYEEVNASEKLTIEKKDWLSILQGFTSTENVYNNYIKEGQFQWDKYLSKIKEFHFTIPKKYEGFIKRQELGLKSELAMIPAQLEAFNKANIPKIMTVLSCSFAVYAKKRNMNFATSRIIWNELSEYWLENNRLNSSKTFFQFTPASFKKYVVEKQGFMIDYSFLSVAILWGCCYVYDFLKALGFVEDKEYKKIKETLATYKKQLINENLVDLWKFTFVHKWTKADMVSTEETAEEQAIFAKKHTKKTANIEYGFFLDPDEMAKHRQFLIPKTRKEQEKQLPSSKTAFIRSTAVPIKNTSKIGRNDKVTVKYPDGTIKKDVKYKKVQKDVEAGKCELIN